MPQFDGDGDAGGVSQIPKLLRGPSKRKMDWGGGVSQDAVNMAHCVGGMLSCASHIDNLPAACLIKLLA